jgi:hypothetical protein
VRRKKKRKKIQGSKDILPLPLHMQGKKENNAVQNGTVVVLFLRKGNEYGNNQKKWVMTTLILKLLFCMI